MRGSTSRKIRQLLELKRSNFTETKLYEVGKKEVGIIDGINGNHRIEERGVWQLFCDENKRLYRQLKKEYKAFSATGAELRKDLKEVQ